MSPRTAAALTTLTAAVLGFGAAPASAAFSEVAAHAVGQAAQTGDPTGTTLHRFTVAGTDATPSGTQSWADQAIEFGAADDGHCVYWAQNANAGETIVRGAVRGAAGVAFSPTAPVTFGAGAAELAANIVLTPDGEHAYVNRAVYEQQTSIRVFDLDPATCVATPNAAQPVITTTVPGGWWLSMSPDGRTLITNSGAWYLSIPTALQTFAIAADGTLTHAGTQPMASSSLTEFVLVTPDSEHVYAIDYKLGRVWQFALGADHQLTPLSPAYVPAPTTAWAATVTAGDELLVADFDSSSSIARYAIAADGRLSHSGTTPVSGFARAGVLVPLDANHVLTTGHRAGDGLPALFRVDLATGATTDLGTLDGDYAWGITTLPDRAPEPAFRVQRNGTKAVFDGSATSDADGDTELTYRWDFGDGTSTTTTSATTEHDYDRPGAYEATLTVSDGDGPAATRVANGFQTLETADVSTSVPVLISATGTSTVASPPATPAPVVAPVAAEPVPTPPAAAPAKPKAAPVTTRPAARAAAARITAKGNRLTVRAARRGTVKATVLRLRGTRATRVGTLKLKAGPKGVSTRFSGRVGGRKLAAGRYRIVVGGGSVTLTVKRR